MSDPDWAVAPGQFEVAGEVSNAGAHCYFGADFKFAGQNNAGGPVGYFC